MQRPLRITARDTELTDTIRQFLEESASKLETFYPAIVGCSVNISVPARRPQGASVHYNVRVQVEVPGQDIVANRQRQPDLRTAIQDAFRAAGRQLQDFNRRQRDPMLHGAAAQ